MLKNPYPLKLYLTRKPVVITLAISLLLNMIGWLWLYFGTTPRGEDAALHYSILFQVDQIGNFSALYQVPLVGLGLLIVNAVVAWLLYKQNAFWAQLLLAATIILQLGILAAVRVLVFLNG